MAFFLKKKPALAAPVTPTPAPPPPAPAPAPVQASKPIGKPLLFKGAIKPLLAPAKAPAEPAPTMAKPSFPIPKPKPGVPVAAAPAPVAPAKPIAKAGIKLGIGKPKMVTAPAPAPVQKVDPVAGMSQEDQAAALKAGLIQHSDLKYDPIAIGDRVVITNSLWPLVKHYQPGDEAVIQKEVMHNIGDPMQRGDNQGHRMFIIKIDKPVDKARMGQTAAVFRKEFKPISKDILGKIPSKKYLMGE